MTWEVDLFPRSNWIFSSNMAKGRRKEKGQSGKKASRDVANQGEVVDQEYYVAAMVERFNQLLHDDVEQQVDGDDVADKGASNDFPHGATMPPPPPQQA